MSKAYDAIQSVYDTVLRDRLPNRWGVYDGIPVRDTAFLDATDTFDPYKPGLKEALDDHLHGDDVVVIGSRGVDAIWLSRRDCDVTVYEGAENMVEVAREAVELQKLSDGVDIHHALVGSGVNLFGDASNADVISPAELDTQDALVMDCEGAEESILAGLADWPETAVVETHPEFGVPTAVTRALLNGHDYDVTAYEYHPDRPDKRVLVGEL